MYEDRQDRSAKTQARYLKLFLVVCENLFFVFKIWFLLVVHPCKADDAIRLRLISMKEKRWDLFSVPIIDWT